ncbi:ABC transporter permease [Vibrio panuliri]|uniref:Thiamine ABC transporter permease n=1 Tax=Vibrio panuliri TaxID=1381081 RepID=A0ABX3FQ18_9VIBR|nr:thiamine ABC transporter permease [Vibrio panuliri]KAB1454714.1 thiamine ABC transporter permease [Vibrio panuliri]OLQ96025.1 thiamine ABC transporter permease [Vibrio panuliri]
MLRLSYIVLVVVCCLPIIPGLTGVLVSSLGYIPPIAMTEFSLIGYQQLTTWNGIELSIATTLFSAVASTMLAALFCFAIVQRLWLSRYWHKVETLLAPLLALPHVAFAIGFAFLFAPTGFIARLAFELLNWQTDTSAQALLVNDAYALGLTLALAFKELPFLLLMSIPVLQQLKLEQSYKIATMLGYSPAQMWLKIVFPQWLSKMRFALFAVIAYGASVVDVALILGPTNPPTFAVLVWQWFNDPELALLPRASAGAVTLFALASGLMVLLVVVEKSVVTHFNQWQFSGRAGRRLPGITILSSALLLGVIILPLLTVWSFAQRWRFPDLIPSQFSLRFWQFEWSNMVPTLLNSVLIALIVASIALLLALIAHEFKLKYRWHLPDYLIALPMLIPQLSMLFGIQVVALYLASDHFVFWVVWSHIFFAFPFVYLALDGPWKSYDPNYTRAGLSLGKSPLRVFLIVKLRMLLPALLYAWAVGASVSLAQYLPTLMLGGGRLATITTEAVALSSGYDRRVTAIYALWQALLPLVFFSAALLASRFTTRRSSSVVKERTVNDSFNKRPHHL